MLELVTDEAITAAQHAFDTGAPVEIFGARFLVQTITIRHLGVKLGGGYILRQAEVELISTHRTVGG